MRNVFLDVAGRLIVLAELFVAAWCVWAIYGG